MTWPSAPRAFFVSEARTKTNPRLKNDDKTAKNHLGTYVKPNKNFKNPNSRYQWKSNIRGYYDTGKNCRPY